MLMRAVPNSWESVVRAASVKLDHRLAAVCGIPDQLAFDRVDHEIEVFDGEVSDPHRAVVGEFRHDRHAVSTLDRQTNLFIALNEDGLLTPSGSTHTDRGKAEPFDETFRHR